jgi:BREX protein BrxB
MTAEMDTTGIKEIFDHLYNVIASQRFLTKLGLGNEVPFFICPYKVAQAVEMTNMLRSLIKNLEQEKGIGVLEINLYDLSIELLKKRNILDRILAMESKMAKDIMLETLQSILDTENSLVPAIAEKMTEKEFQVMFITGVGEVFPFIRSHNVLNNLQSTIKDTPMVMFFPGEYNISSNTGSSLELFGRLQDDKYYRAFNIFHYEI